MADNMFITGFTTSLIACVCFSNAQTIQRGISTTSNILPGETNDHNASITDETLAQINDASVLKTADFNGIANITKEVLSVVNSITKDNDTSSSADVVDNASTVPESISTTRDSTTVDMTTVAKVTGSMTTIVLTKNSPTTEALATVTTTTVSKTTGVPTTVTKTAEVKTTISQTTIPITRETTLKTTRTTQPATKTPHVTTKKPYNCMKSRKDEFKTCFQALGNNAMKYMPTYNLTGFIEDICDENRSKPYMECIKKHFQECPDFLDRPEVTSLQFGPYHIKDIIFFSSINQMCTCAPGLICIQKLLEVKRMANLTLYDDNNPWKKTPNFKTICDYNTARYIGCVRKNLRQCQSPLTKRYGDDFTNEDAEDLKLLYDFTKDHCDAVNEDDFLDKYKCAYSRSVTDDFKQCVQSANHLPSSSKICRLRECVEEHIEDDCDSEMVPLYIDAVNVYRHNTVRLLNFPCSCATEIGIALITLVIAVCIVWFW